MTKHQSMKERMLKKLEKRRERAMAQAQINQLQNNVVSSNSNILPSEDPNRFVFKMEGEGVQEKSYGKREVEKSIDELVAEIGEQSDAVVQKPKTNKKKKGKK
jgi:hypothetical protein